MNKKIMTITLIICMLLGLTTLGYAVQPTAQFEDYISDLYNLSIDNYKFIDPDGNDITEDFYNNTVTQYNNDNIDFVYGYYMDNVEFGERTFSPNARSNNIGKTQTWKVDRSDVPCTLSHTALTYTANIEFIVYATIYYNPNTGIISDTAANITNGPRSTVPLEYLQSPVSLSSNRAAATFRMKVKYSLIDTSAVGVPLADWIFNNNMVVSANS